MLDRKVLGCSLVSENLVSENLVSENQVSKNLVSKSEVPSERCAAGYNEGINSEQIVLMKSRIFLFLIAFHILAGALIGQATPPASTSAAQDSPSKPGAPPNGKAQAPAQAGNSAKSDSDDSVETIRHVVNEVRVVFTVTDRHGRYIKDLKSNDFRVIDDQKPTELRSFRSETDLPLQVGLLVDASNSVRDRFKFEQEAAIEFLNAIIRPGYDKAFVVGFDSTPEVTQDFTDNTENLAAGVRMLRAGGGTAMYDALYFACRDKLMKQEQTGSVRRAIILLSDGDDNSSHVSREEAIEMAERADAIVYTISTNISGTKGKGDKVLERIAEATGGRAFFPFQMRDVSDAFLSIQEELRSQYALAYKPANFIADGRYRTIEILAQDKNLKVRTRKGYYAPK
ncbi:MAG: VWA domain-containing protein [Terriglobales bacterium]|jgi:VWFA-related protein